MHNRTYYKLTFYVTYFEDTIIDDFFFKTREEAEAKQKEIRCRIDCSEINEVTFNELKDEMTVSAFEEFFGVSIVEPLEEVGD